MRNGMNTIRSLVAAATLVLAASPALAGDEERARAAIAEAQGKIDAAVRVKAGDVSPEALSRAQASLRLAQEELKSGKEQKAIASAIEAQQAADSAIGRAQARTDATVAAQSGAAADAQAQAAAANARAAAAEQSAASAAADAQAARAAPPVVVAPATTTVTTETVKTATPAPRVATKTTVKRPVKVVQRKPARAPRAATVEKTTTTVTTH